METYDDEKKVRGIPDKEGVNEIDKAESVRQALVGHMEWTTEMMQIMHELQTIEDCAKKKLAQFFALANEGNYKEEYLSEVSTRMHERQLQSMQRLKELKKRLDEMNSLGETIRLQMKLAAAIMSHDEEK